MPTIFKCTTCLHTFDSLPLLKEHHKSEWHQYNLKKQTVRPDTLPVTEAQFNRKLELLQTVKPSVQGKDHLKTVPPPMQEEPKSKPRSEDVLLPYEPTHSLFDTHISPDVDSNIQYMKDKYSTRLPDIEYLKNKEALLLALGAKVTEDHQCLFCDRRFASVRAVRQHMIDRGHTLIGTNTDEQQELLEPYYDFTSSYKALFLPNRDTLKAIETDIAEGKFIVEDISDDDWIDLGEAHISEDDDYVNTGKENTNSSPAGIPSTVTEQSSNTQEASGTEEDTATEEEETGTEEGATEQDLEKILAKLGLQKATILPNGDLQLPTNKVAVNRNMAYVYKQNIPDRIVPVQKKLALDNRPSQGVTAQSRVNSRRRVEQKYQIHKLKVGMKHNSLPRPMIRSDMYLNNIQ